MQPAPNYLREAATHPINRALLFALLVAGVGGVWRGTVAPLLLLGAVEALWLAVVPRLPRFRQRCDEALRAEQRRQRRLDLERISARLSPNARARLDGLSRQRDRLLDALRTLSASPTVVESWTARLEGVLDAALRILVWVDANRADDRDRRFLDAQIAELEEVLAKLPEGVARAAKLQRLEGLLRQQQNFSATVEQREAAVAQLENLEDLMRELLAQGLAARDSAAFAAQLERFAAQVDAAGESVAALDRASTTEDELAALRRAAR